MAASSTRPGEPWTHLMLPKGWEAKYDMTQKRYFFVDHEKKVTSWEDPRQKIWQQQQRQNNPNSLSTSDAVARGSSQAHSRSASPAVNRPQHRSGHGHDTARSTTPSRDQHRANTPSRQQTPVAASPSRPDPLRFETDKAKHTASSSATPVKTTQSAMQDQIQAKLLAVFSECSPSVVTTALELSSFDELKTRQLMNTWLDSSSTASAAVATSQPPRTGTATPVSGSDNMSVIRNEHQTHYSGSSTTATTSSSIPVKTARSGFKSMTSSTNDVSPLAPASVPHNGNDTASSHHSLAKGHDASLANGPNKHLLLSDYMSETGPRAEYQVGPNPANCHGPCHMFCAGSNPTLVSGSVAARVIHD